VTFSDNGMTVTGSSAGNIDMWAKKRATGPMEVVSSIEKAHIVWRVAFVQVTCAG
jgi:hypothetical protein